MSNAINYLRQLQGNSLLFICFLSIWGIYYAILFLVGFESIYGNLDRAVLFQAIFILLTLLACACLSSPSIRIKHSRINSNFIIYAGITLSIIGIACLLTDKIIIGIDYTKDICSARYQMNNLAQNREGIRSIYSFLGNLLSTSFFVSMGAIITQNVTRKTFYCVSCTSFICLMSLSFVTSSRTTIMLFGAFVLAFMCIRFRIGRKLPRLRLSDITFAIIMLALAGAYITQVFDCRARNSNMTSEQYEQSFAEFLGSAQTTSHTRLHGALGVTALYFVHSAYTFSGIISQEERTGKVLFSYARNLLQKVGITQQPRDSWAFAGKFPSLPGSLYYDFGFLGMIVGSILLGFAIWGTGWLLIKYPNNTMTIGLASTLYVVILLSPLVFAGDILAAPFILFSFIVIWLADYLLNMFVFNKYSKPCD